MDTVHLPRVMFCFNFNINKNDIDYIADRNPKDGLYTPGTKIKIVNEQFSRKKKPNYYLVLPWHFKKILEREKKIISKGTKFIFPLPKLKFHEGSNYNSYL